ncbi:MAG: hypothetical protein V9F82_07385 [Dermatophilaceae bacterium]
MAMGDRRAAERADVRVDFEESADKQTWKPALANPAALVDGARAGALRYGSGAAGLFSDAIFGSGARCSTRPDAPITESNARLQNLATRGAVTADSPSIAGFIAAGGSQRLSVRGVGPTLAAFGLSGALADPPDFGFFPGRRHDGHGGEQRLDRCGGVCGGRSIFISGGQQRRGARLQYSGGGGWILRRSSAGVGGTAGVGLVEVSDMMSGVPAAGAPRLINRRDAAAMSPPQRR